MFCLEKRIYEKVQRDRFLYYDGTTVDDTDNIRKATQKTIESLGR